MEFNSKEEMFAYEKAREKYYMEFLNAGSTFEFYKLWLREIFIPKYRKLKKEYDHYCGGWYRDENNIIHASNIMCVDQGMIKEDDIIFVDY